MQLIMAGLFERAMFPPEVLTPFRWEVIAPETGEFRFL